MLALMMKATEYLRGFDISDEVILCILELMKTDAISRGVYNNKTKGEKK